MANVAVINAIDITSYAFAPLGGEKDAVSRVLDFSARLPEVERVYILTDSSRASKIKSAAQGIESTHEIEVRTGEWSIPKLFEALLECSKDYTDLFYFYADCPLLDSAVAARMHLNHRKYFSEYTFADGYPHGMTPEILLVERIPAVARLVKESDGAIERDTIFTILQRDINSFDVETEISPRDLRLLRVQLSCDTARNFRLTRGVLQAGGNGEENILEVVEGQQELLRTLPAYFEVQVTEAVSQLVSYSPYPERAGDFLRKGAEMSVGRFKNLVDDIAAFAGDAVVSLSLSGEPALHSNIAELVRTCLQHEELEVLIETSGVGWRPEELDAIRTLAWERITWIVDLDASTKELYEKLRGEGWDEAQATTDRLIELFPGRVHVQAVRMQDNEADLEAFYRSWKERVGNVIIQKYDWFCGVLPQKKVTDLSPLRRLPCWHLKRDMVVLVDGRVPMCREDLSCHHLFGNAFERSLQEIWAEGETYYKKHLAKDYPELCKGCDEYYTYNF